jgi:hypothetical protein
LTASQPADDDAQSTEATPDVASEEAVAAIPDPTNMTVVNEPCDEVVIAPIEVDTAQPRSDDEGGPAADTMQDISDWGKDDDEVSDLGISDWEKDDDASSQPGESDTNPSEHQDFEDDDIARHSTGPAHEGDKSPGQEELEVVEAIQPIEAAAPIPVNNDAEEEAAVALDVKEEEPPTGDSPAAPASEIIKQNEASSSPPDDTTQQEPPASATSPAPTESLENGGAGDAPAENQTPETCVSDSIEDADVAAGDAPAAQESMSNTSQPDAPGENAISDASTDAQEDASAHESPVDESEPAVSSEVAKDSDQVIVSATPDDVENPDACTGTYLLCFLCFTSLCPSALLFAGSITHVWTIARHASGESG